MLLNLRKLLTKDKTYKEQKHEKERGKLRYIERQIETEEATQQIKDYLNHPDKKENDEDKSIVRSYN